MVCQKSRKGIILNPLIFENSMIWYRLFCVRLEMVFESTFAVFGLTKTNK